MNERVSSTTCHLGRALPAVVLALLGACGAVAAPPQDPASRATCGLPGFEEDLLRRVNEFRAAPRSCGVRGHFASADPLRWSVPLARLAALQAQGMARLNRVEHEDAGGRSPPQRATQAGYAWHAYAENIAGNYPGTAQVMAGWQASAGHCANLMNPSLTEVGVACAPGVRGSEYRTYWAMELARPR